ncbi:hypothetical protein LMH87_001885 [Akanthomyces muscarius]|uniref:Uncharacterized protein n=1 Tax=Akanthomyces muscarius TaxID=2231603 RepID=A0A9W8Q5R2_AKAMU|nr:hypothetical protein LMH87_001885 [Akanthomyces muscarius]KAJ4147358.1 hypothetical protein LMH87_001885 [Akanthomyces muscarius]
MSLDSAQLDPCSRDRCPGRSRACGVVPRNAPYAARFGTFSSSLLRYSFFTGKGADKASRGAPGVCGLCHQARCASPGQAIRERKAPKRSFSEFSVVNGAALRWNILGPVQGKPTPYSATAGEN